MPNIDSAGKPGHIKPPIVKNSPPGAVSLISLKQKKQPTRILKRIFFLIVVIIIIIGSILFIKVSNLSQKIFVGQKTTFFGQIYDFIRGGGDNEKLVGEEIGQINLLLLGIGGEGHEGPYLSDTVILAQIRPDIGEITLTSIPRDYLVTLPDSSQQKINAAFALGYAKNKDWDKAGQWARTVAENTSGLKVPYFAVIDFSGFEKAVDKIGGIDIKVDKTFTDSQYPDNGFGYLAAQTFTQGQQHFDGSRALIFARSRHGSNNEGSDFARSIRQQKIIEAFKQKIFSLNLIKDVAAINDLTNIFADHFHTNISPSQLLKLYNLIKNKNMATLSLSLDPETGLVCDEILASNGAYVLVPCKSEELIKNFFKNSFAVAKIKKEQATVWLASSTGNKDAYNSAYRQLTDLGVSVYNLNYSKDNLNSTVIYRVNPKPGTAEFIKNQLNAVEVTLPPPGVTVNKDKVDIIIVLGQNAKVLPTPVPYIAPPARVNTTTPETASTTPTSTAGTTKVSNATTTPIKISPTPSITPTPKPTATPKNKK